MSLAFAPPRSAICVTSSYYDIAQCNHVIRCWSNRNPKDKDDRNNNNNNNNSQEKENLLWLDEAHKLAMEEDEEWYRTFILNESNDDDDDSVDETDWNSSIDTSENDSNRNDEAKVSSFQKRNSMESTTNHRRRMRQERQSSSSMKTDRNDILSRQRLSNYRDDQDNYSDRNSLSDRDLILDERRRTRMASDVRKLPRKKRIPMRSRNGKRVDNIEPDGKFWPNLPTFKQFLRQESELRLMILGPGFADTIRDEASWRLKLYEQWLVLLEDGYGEDNTFVTSTGQREYAQEMRKRVSMARERNKNRIRDLKFSEENEKTKRIAKKGQQLDEI